jgi:hypothetical protein
LLTLTQGKPLGAGDISILPRDSKGAVIDPAVITYTIFQVSSDIPLKSNKAYEFDLQQPSTMPDNPVGTENMTLASPPKSVPTRMPMGGYYVNITIPTTWHGIYRIVWYMVQYDGGDETKVYEDFVVQTVDPASNSFEAASTIIAPRPFTTNKYAPAIMYVRELLSDTNPDRNYHFRPPTPGKVVAGYTTRVGFIWLDSTILRMLDIAIAKLNTWNPKNFYNWSLDNVPRDWGKCAALAAASLCLSSEGCRWAADEFSYSLNGVSLDINKSSMYQSLGQSYDQQFNEWAPLLTANRPFSVGLRQQRWLLG